MDETVADSMRFCAHIMHTIADSILACCQCRPGCDCAARAEVNRGLALQYATRAIRLDLIAGRPRG